MTPPSGRDVSTLVLPSAIPQRIGRYEIQRLIGTGGMGAVYEAVQDQPRRTVALKVMRAAVASPMALRRFEYESQLLAKLRHPGIAQVYDAGTHEDSLTRQSVPYFAMEYIPDASSLTAYARNAGLSMRQRLELFIKVCDAVHHGHQRGIIHRDLKPANILVDQQGGAKIIDFGVARSLEPETGRQVTEHTSAGQLVGTLQYMAPEQCGASQGELAEIDSRADVYALGVTLYELLTEADPYDLSGCSLVEATRIVRETPPRRPSLQKREVRGDIETIILKALEKEPSRRYDSASALAADIERYLRSEPILARRTGVAGRLARWVKRNRAVATVAAIALVVLAVTTVALAARIISENRRANAELIRANDNMARIRDMFSAMTLNNAREGWANVGAILDDAASKLDAAPPPHPATEADFREFLAEGYIGLGMNAKAIAQQERVVELRERLLPDAHPALAHSLHQLGRGLYFSGQYARAAEVYTRALEMRRTLDGAKSPEIAASMTHLAACRLKQGRLADAEDLFKQALEMRQELLPPGSKELAQSWNNLAKCVLLRGDKAGAEELFRRALTMVTAALGDEDLETAYALHNLAMCLLESGKAQAAKETFERAIAIRSAKLPPTHNLLWSSRLGRARAAFALAGAAGEVEPAQGAIADAQAALSGLENELKADHPDLAGAALVVGQMYAGIGAHDRAEPYLRRALSIYKDPARSTPWELAEARLSLSRALIALKNVSEAEQLLRQSMDALAGADAPREPRDEAIAALADLLDSQGKSEEAAKVRSGKR